MPVRDEAGHIARSLVAVLGQDYPAERMEILVVDGMSRDGTRDIVDALAQARNGHGPRVRLIDNPRGTVPPALNLGVENARGEIIVRIDGHTVVPQDTVRLLVETLRESRADAAGGVARASGHGYLGSAIAEAFRTPFGVGDARFRYSDRSQDVKTAYPIAWRREVFDLVGRFDERFPRVQDADFNYRLVHSGGRIRLDPRVASEYFTRANLVALWRQYLRTGAYKARLARKHGGLPSTVQYMPAALVACLVASAAIIPFSKPVGLLVPLLYALSSAAASIWTASRQGWKYLPVLPAVFAVMHLAWGVGFWLGATRDILFGWHRDPSARWSFASLARAVLVPAAAVVLLLGSALTFVNLGRWISTPDPIRTVDALVVPSGNTFHRLNGAVELAKAGVADQVWVVVPAGSTRTEQGRIERFVRRRGFDPADVTVVGSSASTRQDAAVVRAELPTLGIDRPRIGVVTSPWHVARARLTFDRELGRRVRVVSFRDGEAYPADRWWVSNASRSLGEGVKYVGTMAVVGRAPTEGRGPDLMNLVAALLVGLMTAALVGSLCRALARRLGLVVTPRLWRRHDRPVPLLGGLAVLAGTAAGLIVATGPRLSGAALVATLGVGALALVGLFDDIAGLRPTTRIAWALAAGGMAWGVGLRVDVFGSTAGGKIGDAALTLLWFAGVTHALNILDNIDGGAVTVGAASALTMGAVAFAGGQALESAAAIALCGACIGFLMHNNHPARLFLGDMGALALGFALAALGLGLRPNQGPPLSAIVPVLALGVPIFDVVLVTVARVRGNRSVSVGGTDHTAHRLVARGLTPPRAVAVLWVGQLLLGAAAFAIAQADVVIGWIVTAIVAVAGLAVLRVFLELPAWEAPAPRESEPASLTQARANGNGHTNGIGHSNGAGERWAALRASRTGHAVRQS